SLQATLGTPPTKRYGHTAALWRHYIIIFGGTNEFQEYCNDVILFDLKQRAWSRPPITGHQVLARYLHTAVIYDDKMYVYGGFAKNAECTYVLSQMSVLDLNTFAWSKPHPVPPRYNHSALLVHDRMYIYAGKDGSGKTVTDLYVVDLRLGKVLPQTGITGDVELLKSHHFTEYVGDGRLVMFGKFMKNEEDSEYNLWLLDLGTLEWSKLPKERCLERGVWNYFTVATAEELGESASGTTDPSQRRLVFLGNADPKRPQLYDHFRDLLVVNLEPAGVWQVPATTLGSDFAWLLDHPELADFSLRPQDDEPVMVHRAVLCARWPHFRNLQASGMRETKDGWLELPESSEVVNAFVYYLYVDQLPEHASWEVVTGVLEIANIYLLPRLAKLCCRLLVERHMSLATCAPIFQAAVMAGESGLKLVALEYIFMHFGSVWRLQSLSMLN
ncbi:hypothetical protein THASP1DRAFT_8637, partial [Thamnocephalis sphaerospora]